jgi:phosphoribosylformylglycinamidine synthase
VALAEMCLASGMGARLQVPGDAASPAGWLFGEEQGRYLLAVGRDELRRLLDEAVRSGVIAREIGATGGHALKLEGYDPISLEELRACHSGWLPVFMAGQDAGREVRQDEG